MSEKKIPMKRCEWANKSGFEQSYHDTEWGVAINDDRSLFWLSKQDWFVTA